MAETNSSGTTLATYVYDDKDQLVSMTRSENTYFYQYNAHGDVMTLTDSTGTVVNTYTYDPWGKVLSSTEGVSNPYRYAGYRYDSTTALYYLNSRYYDSSLARFLTQDSNSGHIKKPMSINGYIYCLDNPLILTDVAGTAGNSVHDDLTALVVYSIAINEFHYSADMSLLIAAKVAKADKAVDYNKSTKSESLTGLGRHMNVNKNGAPSQEIWAQSELEFAIDNNDPIALGRALHSLQDMMTHGTEYMKTKHAYQNKRQFKCRGKNYTIFDSNNPDVVPPHSQLWNSIWDATSEYVREFFRGAEKF